MAGVYSIDHATLFPRGVATVSDRVIAIIADHLDCAPRDVRPDMLLLGADLCADELSLVEIALALEEQFELPDISDADIEAWRTVADVIAFVERTGGQQ